jgi:hypothetical protein
MWTRRAPDYQRSSAAPPASDPVVIAGVDIPFWDLVKLQVKFAIAAIPAAIILVFVVAMGIALLRELGR